MMFPEYCTVPPKEPNSERKLIVRFAPAEHSWWLIERTTIAWSSGLRCIEALDPRSGDILGMLGFDTWTPRGAEIHFAVDVEGVMRPLLRAGLDYVFNQAGKKVLFGVTPANKTKVMELARGAGFKEVARYKNGWDEGVDLIIHEVSKEDFKFHDKREN
jgi:RimJ/RimL family protein N-acetyltransferase